jgi:hypothetical protein
LKVDGDGRPRFVAGTLRLTAAGFAAVFVVLALATGCASTWPAAPEQTAASPRAASTDTYMLHAPQAAAPANSASKPPRLSVGTSYPDTQLILPWFLNDIINFVNYR